MHAHAWRDAPIVHDTLPPTVHRYCSCRRIESRMGDGPWRECFESRDGCDDCLAERIVALAMHYPTRGLLWTHPQH